MITVFAADVRAAVVPASTAVTAVAASSTAPATAVFLVRLIRLLPGSCDRPTLTDALQDCNSHAGRPALLPRDHVELPVRGRHRDDPRRRRHPTRADLDGRLERLRGPAPAAPLRRPREPYSRGASSPRALRRQLHAPGPRRAGARVRLEVGLEVRGALVAAEPRRAAGARGRCARV